MVGIKGIEMPKSCYIGCGNKDDTCNYFRLIKIEGNDAFFCNILNDLISHLELTKNGAIAPNCPLIEIHDKDKNIQK